MPTTTSGTLSAADRKPVGWVAPVVAPPDPYGPVEHGAGGPRGRVEDGEAAPATPERGEP